MFKGNPFSSLRQAIAHGTFEDPMTRHYVNSFIDCLDGGIDEEMLATIFQNAPALSRVTVELQKHLVDLLVDSDSEEATPTTVTPLLVTGKITSIKSANDSDSDFEEEDE